MSVKIQGENLTVHITYYTSDADTSDRVWVFICSLAGNAGSNPTGGMDVCLL